MGPVIAASDYLKLMPGVLAKHAPNGLVALGTDGFGRSDDRPALRQHFEVDAHAIAWSVLASLAAKGQYDAKKLEKARGELGIDINKPNPREKKWPLNLSCLNWAKILKAVMW